MSALFASASSQYLVNSVAPVTAVPLTVGMIVSGPTISTNKQIFDLTDTGSSNHSLRLQIVNTDVFRITAQAGGTAANGDGGTFVAGRQFCVIGRFIGATNRRMAIVDLSLGSVTHVTNTTNRTPTGIDSVAIGCRLDSTGASNFMNGFISEFWYADVDIQEDGAQLMDSTARQLAMYGPFSLPHIAHKIIEYRSFRSVLTSGNDNPREVYCRATRPTWANTNGVILGPHPPLPSGFFRPVMPLMPPVIV